ncbi:MAG: hypothetical protein NVSMB30_08900 [Hymenobacter sp.]
MRLALALALNSALLAVLLPWLRRQWQQGRGGVRLALVVGLGGRVGVGIVTGLHLVNDAYHMSQFGRQLTAQCWAAPAAALRTLGGDELHFAGQDMVFHGMSNTFFFVKVIALLNLASLTTDWLNAVYLSVFSFVGCWALAKALGRAFPQTPAGAALLAFVVWPSVIFWASGVTKESVVLGSGAGLLAVFVRVFFARDKVTKSGRVLQVGALAMLAIIHFKMRYFFAVPLLGGLAALGLLLALQRAWVARRRWAQVMVMVAVLAGGAWLASEVSVAFRLNKFTNQVMRIYDQHVAASVGQPHFEYPDLQPTPESIVRHLPQAAANALTRPWLGESRKMVYVAAGLENAVLLVLLAVAVVAVWRGKGGRLPFGLVLALAVHCLVLALLLGLSTPNLGSLHRYRSGLLPYLLLLVLQNEYVAATFQRLGLLNPPGWSPSGSMERP